MLQQRYAQTKTSKYNMEENSLPPVQPVLGDDASNSLDVADANAPVSSYSLTQKNYPIETLEVKNEGASKPLAGATSSVLRNSPLSRRKATLISLLITFLVVFITGIAVAYVVKKNTEDNSVVERNVPTQGVSISNPIIGANPIGLQDETSLLVNGDIIARGDLKVASGASAFVSILRTGELNADQTLTLPNASGTICLDSNNCDFADQTQVTQIEQQLNQIVIPPAGVTELNGQAGTVSIQGSTNQISVSTSGGVITLSTPQDLDANANVQFGSLTIGPTGEIRSNSLSQTGVGNNVVIDAGADGVLITDGNRTFQFPGGGGAVQTVCTTQGNCGGGGATPVLLAPGAAQSDSSADVSIFINDTGGGHLIQLQSGGVDRLVVTNSGNTTVGGSLTVSGLGNGPVRATGGLLSVGAIDLGSSDVTGTLTVTNGGTGAPSLAANGVLLGNGASAITSVASGGAGLCFISNVGAPSWQACPGGGGVTTLNAMAGGITIQGTTNQINVANGAGLITLSTPQDIATTSDVQFDALELTGLLHSTNSIDIDMRGVIGAGNALLPSTIDPRYTLTVTDTFSIDCATGCAGVYSAVELGAAANPTSLSAFDGRVRAANGQTLLNAHGLLVESATVAGTGIIGANYGIRINSQTAGFSDYGLYIQNADSYAIWVDGGLTRLDGGVWLEGGSPIEIEGSTNDTFQTTLAVVNPTADRTITFPNLTGTVCLDTGNCVGSGGSAPNTATYLVTSLDGTLTNERALLAGTNIAFTDGGAGGSFTIANTPAATFSTSVTTPLLTSTGALAVTPGGVMTLGATGQTALLQGSTTSITSTGAGNDIVLNSADTIELQDNTNVTGTLNVSGSADIATHLVVGNNAAPTGVAVISSAENYNGTDCGVFGCYGILSVINANGVTGTNPHLVGVYSSISLLSGSIDRATALMAANVTGPGTVTDNYGLIIENMTKGTNDYGIWIQGADTYALWVDSGISRFDGLSPIQLGGSNDGDNLEFTLAVAEPTADRTYTIPNSSATTDSFCLVTLGNCAGSGGGVTGSGTNDRVAKFTSTGSTVGDSSLSDNGSAVTVNGNVNLTVQGTNVTVGLGSTRTGSITLNNSTNNNTVALQSGITGTSYALTLPTAVGGVGQCLKAQDGTGTLFWDGCLGGGGGGGITSLDGQTGPSITINNASGAANAITIDDAVANGVDKGIAAFNVTNFSAAAGVVNTIQGISTAAAPQFAGLTLTGNLGMAANTISGTTAAIDFTNFDVASNGNTAVGGTLAVTGLTTLSGGLTVDPGDAFTFNSDAFTDLTGNGLQVSTGVLTLAVQADKGLEVDGNGLSFIDCALDQILKYNGSNQWVCAADAGGSGVGDDVLVNGVAATNANFLNTAASGTSTSTTWNLDTGATPDDITLTIGNASVTDAGAVTTGAQTFAGAKTFNGQIVTGAGISLGSQTLQGTTAVIDFTNFDVSSGGTVTAAGDMVIQGGDLTAGTASQAASILLHDGDGETITFALPDVSASYVLTLPTAVGGADQCLKAQNGTGTLFWDNCLGGTGGGGITSVDGQTGPAISINNAIGAANAITIDNAAADGTTKGIAAFNATNFSAAAGVVNTIQGISTAASPQFVGLTLTGDLQVDGNSTIGNAFTDTLTVNAASTFTAAMDVVLADLEDLSVGSTITGTNSVSVLNMSVTNNTSSGTQNLALLQNAAGSGTTDGLLVLDNADADTAVAAGIVMTAATGGGITTAIDVSDPDITNALLFGANDVIGTNFTVAGASGAVTGGTYNGQTISATASFTGTLGVAGLATLNGGLTVDPGDTFTFNSDAFTDLTGNGLQVTANALTLDATVSGDGLSATTSSGSGLEVLASGLTLLQGCADSDVLKWNEATDLWGCAVDNGGTNPWATDTGVVNLVTDGNTVTIGSATTGGKLFVDGDADEIQLQLQGNGTQTADILVAESSAGADLFNVQGDGDIVAAGDLAVNGGDITSTATLNINATSTIALQDNTTLAGNFTANTNDFVINNTANAISIRTTATTHTLPNTAATVINNIMTIQSSNSDDEIVSLGDSDLNVTAEGSTYITYDANNNSGSAEFAIYTGLGGATPGFEEMFLIDNDGDITTHGDVSPNAASAHNLGSATTEFNQLFMGDNNGINLGLDQDALLAYDETTDDRVELTGTGASLWIEDRLSLGRQTFTMATGGAATENLTPTASYVEITGQDNALDIAQIQTASAKEGDVLIITNISATTVNVDQNATTKLSGGVNAQLDQYDVMMLIFDGTNWLQVSASLTNS